MRICAVIGRPVTFVIQQSIHKENDVARAGCCYAYTALIRCLPNSVWGTELLHKQVATTGEVEFLTVTTRKYRIAGILFEGMGINSRHRQRLISSGMPGHGEAHPQRQGNAGVSGAPFLNLLS